jgi:hypothetical protein
VADTLKAESLNSRAAANSGDRLEHYLQSGIDSVDGWLDGFSARFIASISRIQQQAGYSGSSGEIGIHHGKLFLVLRLATDEPCFAIDVFEQQHLNIDNSGYGNRSIFLANLRRWAGSEAGVEIIAKSSLDVLPSDIVEPCGKVRLLSIDGGHSEDCVLSDFRLAERILHPYGVAIADDYFNPSWPSVSVGVARHCLDPATQLRPFAISPNKLYLTRPEFADAYRDRLHSQHRTHFQKHAEMFGAAVDIYQETGSAVRSIAGTISARHPRLWGIVRHLRSMLRS